MFEVLLMEPEYEICIICGYETEGIKCKFVCPNCGSKRDCSDP